MSKFFIKQAFAEAIDLQKNQKYEELEHQVIIIKKKEILF